MQVRGPDEEAARCRLSVRHGDSPRCCGCSVLVEGRWNLLLRRWRQINGEVLQFPAVAALDFNRRPETTHGTLRRCLFPRSRRPPDRTLAVALRRDNHQVLLPPFLDVFVEALFNCGRADPDTVRRHLDGVRGVKRGHCARIALVESFLPLVVAVHFISAAAAVSVPAITKTLKAENRHARGRIELTSPICLGRANSAPALAV